MLLRREQTAASYGLQIDLRGLCSGKGDGDASTLEEMLEEIGRIGEAGGEGRLGRRPHEGGGSIAPGAHSIDCERDHRVGGESEAPRVFLKLATFPFVGRGTGVERVEWHLGLPMVIATWSSHILATRAVGITGLVLEPMA